MKNSYETLEKLFQAMEEHVNTAVLHWKTDFSIDKDIISKNGSGTYVWFLRDCGTHLIHLCGEKAHQGSYYANVIRHSFEHYKEYCIVIDTIKGVYELSLVADYMSPTRKESA